MNIYSFLVTFNLPQLLTKSQFLKLYQDTTTIMITHRLGATSLCDWIIAIEDGKAMEQGSHEDLMTKNGIYCEMYETQRRWYL